MFQDKNEAAVVGHFNSTSPPRNAALLAHFGSHDIYNLAAAYKPSESEIKAAHLLGGQTGANEARNRLNPILTVAASKQQGTSNKRGKSDKEEATEHPAIE